MYQALELLRLSGLTEAQIGTILALLARAQGAGGTVHSTIASLRASEQAGSLLARNTLASFEAADQVLKGMAGGSVKTPRAQ